MNEAHDCVRWSTCSTRIKENVYERGELQTRYKFESTIIVCPSTSHQSIVISSTLRRLRHEIFIGFLSFFFYIHNNKKCSTLSSSRTHTQHRMPHHFFFRTGGKFNVERGGGKLRLQREEKRSVRVNLFASSRQSWEEKKSVKNLILGIHFHFRVFVVVSLSFSTLYDTNDNEEDDDARGVLYLF